MTECSLTALRNDKAAITNALGRWIAQRPGLEFGNYGDVRSYRAEMRGITRDYRDAHRLLQHVDLSSISGEELAAAFRSAYSGRLSWDGERLTYCAGQYWPTEYRRAAAAVLASALWYHWRDGMTGERIGDRVRAAAARTFGRGIASRWFN